MARTNFGGGSLVAASSSAVYDGTHVGDFRRAAAARQIENNGDPRKMAQAIIDPTYCRPAPRWLALGSDAYAMICAALSQRLGALDAQRSIAIATDVDPELPLLVATADRHELAYV